jgi:hypothetical protein
MVQKLEQDQDVCCLEGAYEIRADASQEPRLACSGEIQRLIKAVFKVSYYKRNRDDWSPFTSGPPNRQLWSTTAGFRMLNTWVEYGIFYIFLAQHSCVSARHLLALTFVHLLWLVLIKQGVKR